MRQLQQIDCQRKMRFKERDQASIRSYSRISLQKRKRLVELVLQKGLLLSKVVKKLKLKLTTARLIIQRYKTTGQFPMRSFRKGCAKTKKSETAVQIQEQESAEQKQQVVNMADQEIPEILQIEKKQENISNYYEHPFSSYYCWPLYVYYQWHS